MERVALDLGFIQIYWYSIFIFIGLLAGCTVICLEAKKRSIDETFLTNLIFNTVVFGFVGARLYYVLFNLPYYLSNPLEILEVWNGGLAIHGGIILGAITAILYSRKKNIDILQLMDILVVGLILAQAIGRWGNFFNSEAYGSITTMEILKSQKIPMFVIKGMYILGDYRQPTFFYESTWCLCGFLSLILIRRCKYLKKGQLTGIYLIWYGLLRFIIEGMRSDSLMLGNLKIARIISILFIIGGIVLFLYNIFKSTAEDQKLYTDVTKIKQEDNQVYFIEEEHA